MNEYVICGSYHAGGNEKMKEMVPGLRIYGGALDDVEGCTHGVQDGDTIALGAYTSITCLLTPWYIYTNLFMFNRTIKTDD